MVFAVLMKAVTPTLRAFTCGWDAKAGKDVDDQNSQLARKGDCPYLSGNDNYINLKMIYFLEAVHYTKYHH